MLNRAIDQLIQLPKTDDGFQGQGCLCSISSGLTMCVNDRCCFIVCWVRVKIH